MIIENFLKGEIIVKMENKISIKCILLGNTAVGKSSFINALNKLSIKNIHPTTGVQIATFDIEDTNIRLQVYDTAGQEKFRSLTQQYFRDIQMIFFFTTCDDTTKEVDDESLEEFITMAKDCATQSYQSIFLLNKIDLYEKRPDDLSERIAAVQKRFIDGYPELNAVLVPISCLMKDGIPDVWKLLKEISVSIKPLNTGFKIGDDDDDDNNNKKKSDDDNGCKC